MKRTITKDILRKTLRSGQISAIELLYNIYGAMLFNYVLQFIPGQREAEGVLVNMFSHLAPRLEEACDSSLSIYSWLQIEARKFILEDLRQSRDGKSPAFYPAIPDESGGSYFSLLQDASPEHQWVFREIYLHGKQKDELATESGKELADVNRLLNEALLIIRKRLG